MLVKGDKIKLIKPMSVFDNVGEVYEVVSVTDGGLISFKFGEGGIHMRCMSNNEFEEYFEKYEEPISVPLKHIENVMNHSKVTVQKVYGKCTIVAVQLPSGFVIVESSSCVDPANYDEDTGVEICMNRIKDRICEMEAYRLQEELANKPTKDIANKAANTDCHNKDEEWLNTLF